MCQHKLATWMDPFVAINIEDEVVEHDQRLLVFFDLFVDLLRCIALNFTIDTWRNDMAKRPLVADSIDSLENNNERQESHEVYLR